jgi:hypothetical protein
MTMPEVDWRIDGDSILFAKADFFEADDPTTRTTRTVQF